MSRYLVVSVENSWCNIRKFVGSQLRNTSYRVRQLDCYKVPYVSENTSPPIKSYIDQDSEDECIPNQNLPPPLPPNIPDVISVPPQSEVAQFDVEKEDTEEEEDSGSVDAIQNNVKTTTRPVRERRLPKHFENSVLY